MRQQFVAGNWKMHGSLAGNAALLSEILAGVGAARCEVAVCVPYPYLSQVQQLLQTSQIALGAQDCSAHQSGAHTGEVAVSMLRDFGCRYVIVGHSERRADHHESDVLVAAKAERALEAGMTPIVCVGETLQERQSGQTHAVVLRQLQAVTHLLGAQTAHIVVAYEPVWAIGTGLTATPEQAQEVHAVLRGHLRTVSEAAAGVRILYGGSVKPDNAGVLFSQPDIDGGLIGGASLKAADFLAIIAAAR
ncbi:MAG: triose-phosphate isomerase [Thiomonas sp.]|uniref:triose-phosphate isomerase n=1 Tax=Thiomonas sp. TaxID=2047785 RepID=UPI002A366B28|nr:triose-phosphate isomerase [Thiomonas sp.]MDY0330050.1 triose-phosphate isomerase [Thiomonas sp.]